MKSSKKNEKLTPQQAESHFFKNSFLIMFNQYDPKDINKFYDFPQVRNTNHSEKIKQHSFNSTIVDLRIKRSIENSQNNEKYCSDIEKQIDMLQKELTGSHSDLSEILARDKVDRPNTPLYLLHEGDHFQKEHEQARLGITNKRMKKKLEQSEARGKERAQKRLERLCGINQSSPKSKRTKKEPWDSSPKAPKNRSDGLSAFGIKKL